jgi:hypothetical protein
MVPPGYFYDKNANLFNRCMTGCSMCLDGVSCIKCDEANKYYFFFNDKKCYLITTPPTGYKFDTVQSRFVISICTPGCVKCSSDTACEICQKDFLLNEGKCVLSSINVPGFFWDKISPRLTPCSTNCLTCRDSNICTSCDASKSSYLVNENNTAKCYLATDKPTGCFFTNNGFVQCSLGCVDCLSATACRTCDANRIKHTDDKCYLKNTPPTGTYFDFANNRFTTIGMFFSKVTSSETACIANCDRCSDASTCNSCKSGILL